MLQLTMIIFVKYLLKCLFYSSQRIAAKGVLSALPANAVQHGTRYTKPRLK